MQDPIGFGIIGCGTIAPFHARAIRDLPDARLVAVQTSDPEKGKMVVAESGGDAKVYTDLDEMLALPDLHVVDICTPSGAHLEPAEKAARAGKHVIVEKPLEVTLERCDRLIACCRAANVQLGAIFPSRFTDVNQRLREALAAGRFGRVALGDSTVKWWRPQSYYDGGGWRGTWRLDGGGALMNQAIHNVDLLQWLLGPVVEVGAMTGLLAHSRIEVEDAAVAILRFASGALGSIEATTAAYPGLLKTIGIHGDRGSAVVEQDRVLTWQFTDESPDDVRIRSQFAGSASTGGASDPKAISHEGHTRQLADFVEAIQRGRPPLIDGAEGRKSVEIILAVYQSQATGRFVRLPLVSG